MRMIFICGLLCVLIGCAEHSSSPHDPTIMKSYRVEPAHAEQLENTLANLMTSQEGRGRRAMLVGESLLVVSAPMSFHGGIQSLIKEVGRAPVPERRNAKMSLWVVEAIPAESTLVPRSIRTIEAALKGVVTELGPTEFRRLDYLHSIQRSGIANRVKGASFSVRSELVALGNRIAANLKIDANGAGILEQELETELDLETGQTIVMAHTGIRSTNENSLLFIVRIEVES